MDSPGCASLDLSKLESGRMPVRVEDFDVRDLVKQSLEHVEQWAKQKKLGLVAQFDTQVEAIQADPDLTSRVLVNLLDNAIKFSPPESTITVRVAAVQDGILAFSVIDQGPGIPEEWQDRIFDKFISVEARTRGVAIGSGLGLHFCRQAVKAQGGQIWLETGQAGSTTFHFTLPTAGGRIGNRYSRKRQTRHKPPSNNLAVLLPERPHRYTHFGQES